MFGWFRPTCPVDPNAKNWVERRLQWLASEFGLDIFVRRAMILPLEEFFPDAYDASLKSVRVLLDRVCRYMDADPRLVELELFTDRNEVWLVNDRGQYLPRTAGLYDERSHKTVIHLETSQLDEPMTLVGTIAHELAHLRLLGERRIPDDVFDNELLTDLTVVFHGLGLFLANVPRTWPSDFTTWPGSNGRKPEYMTQPMFGYALAHAAWFRQEPKPAWIKHLRMDARASFKQGLRYLLETGDSQFKPGHAR
ncbi:MAG: hypothetical protein KF777_10320 [Planctomycetaceae bacterium]|nr:hypothetical protein [Planctomycetaceae bacterium]